MAQASLGWEKDQANSAAVKRLTRGGNRTKFLIVGVLILAAALYLIITNTLTGGRYFITIDELIADEAYVGQTVRISGAVIGETIVYDTSDPNMPVIEFTISHIPTDYKDLALALHESVNNPAMQRVPVRVENEAMPDLLQNEAQAILTGELGPDGVFHANELLLKCPSRFEESQVDPAIAAEA